jgi:hydroxymethylglutaryl-CoA lyase
VADKVRLIDLLSETGLRKIESASFVSPKWVPQMAGSAEVMAGISRRPGVRYTALTPNLKGYEAAKAANADEVAVFASASEGFSRANINCSVAESLERFRPVLEAARADGLPVRGYVSCVTDCPYDGRVEPGRVARVAEALDAMGCCEVSLGDTIGAATPETTDAMLAAVLDAVPAERLALHPHDTRRRALENIGAALERGLRAFDSSVAGLGGCPFAPGAAGNVATGAVVDFLEARGYATGIDREALERAAAFARTLREPADA